MASSNPPQELLPAAAAAGGGGLVGGVLDDINIEETEKQLQKEKDDLVKKLVRVDAAIQLVQSLKRRKVQAESAAQRLKVEQPEGQASLLAELQKLRPALAQVLKKKKAPTSI